MPPKNEFNITSNLISALKDESVRAIFGELIQDQLKKYAETVDFLLKENDRKNSEIDKLTAQLSDVNSQLGDLKKKSDALEAYNRRDNLIIAGVPIKSYSEAATVSSMDNGNKLAECSTATEQAVLELCHNELKLDISSTDISVAHRLKTSQKSSKPPAIIVRFTNRKVREAVYAARLQLKNCKEAIFINEDLTKNAADLFSQARKLVKENKLLKTWTHQGLVYIKSSSNPSVKPKLVESKADLPN